MRIEENWTDGFLYCIEFKVEQYGEFKIIRKNIIIYDDMSEVELARLVMEKFPDVKSIEHIDFCEDVLLLKM